MDHRKHSTNGGDRARIPEMIGDSYQGDRLGAKALIHDDDHVLLIQERREDESRFWTLPGGGVRTHESFTECLRRELREELRARVTVGAPIATCTYEHTTSRWSSTTYLVFTGELDDTPTPNYAEGIIDFTWVLPKDLPVNVLDPFRRLLQTPVTRRIFDTRNNCELSKVCQ